MVSVFPFLVVSVNTDFKRYVPIERSDLLLDKITERLLDAFDQLAPLTLFQMPELLSFCKVCSTAICLIVSIPEP